MGVVLTMTLVIITALAITRERERGTMENLLSTPVKPFEVIIGKITPYIIVGYVQMGVILLAAFFLIKVPIIGNLSLKMGIETIPAENLVYLTSVANQVSELANFEPDAQQPYVGASAFAHKAGLHTSAIARRPDAYEHIDPSLVGNHARFVVSEMAGKAGIEIRAQQIGIELDPAAISEVLDILKRLEHEGYQFEVADASLELLLRGAAGWLQPFFELESFRISTQHRSGSGARAWNDVAVEMETEATVKLVVDGDRVASIGEGNGPVNALHAALREAIGTRYPAFETIALTEGNGELRIRLDMPEIEG